nr:MAG: hypothetical protein [Aspergillus flavus vivivirus 1]
MNSVVDSGKGVVGKELAGFDWQAVDVSLEDFQEAADLVSTGWFDGPEVALLMERLALRLEAAEEAIKCAKPALVGRAYTMIVEQLEPRLGLQGPPVRKLIAEMRHLALLYGDVRQAPRGISLLHREVPGAAYKSLTGGSVALVDPAVGVKERPANDQVLIPVRVYRALLGLDVPAGEASFSVVRGVDGLFRFEARSESATGYTVTTLPTGYYLLPGGMGCIVPVEVIRTLLELVWVFAPRERQRGYCYLMAVPPLQREVIAQVLGPFPTVGQLEKYCPDVYSWSADEARVVSVTDGYTGETHYHVETSGRLPQSLELDVPMGAEEVHEAPPHIRDVFLDFEKRLGARERSLTPARPVAAPSESVSLTSRSRAPSHVRSHSRSLSAGFEPSRAATPVFTLRPGGLAGAGPAWTEYENPHAREWANRLAAGPPLGHSAMKSLVEARKGEFPELPVAEGGRVVALPSATMLGHKLANWKTAACPVPGWAIQRLASTSGGQISIVPPVPGMLTRYEFSADESFQANGVGLPRHRTTVWCDGNLVVTGVGRRASVWRMWHEGGAAALGVEHMALHVAYQYPAIVPVRSSKTQVLCAKLYSCDEARGERLYKASTRAYPGESEVHLYTGDAVNSEAVVLGIAAQGLVRAMVHGTVLTAVGGQVMCVTDMAFLTVTFIIAHDRYARRDGEVLFEIRRVQGHGAARAKVKGVPLLTER